MKLPAPALDKGITVLQLLAQEGELSLETICNLTQVPKASLLRFLETLMAKGCVFKDPATKKYRALKEIVPMQGESSDFMRLLDESLTQLSIDHNVTSEWYELYDEGARIVMRHEPENNLVRVIARVGFSRVFNNCFESVVKVALAGNRSLYAGNEDNYHKLNWRERIELSHDEISADLDKVQADGYISVDDFYNDNGVLRVAAAVRDENKDLKGIFALAFSYEPNQEKFINDAKEDLKRTVDILEQQLRTMKFKK